MDDCGGGDGAATMARADSEVVDGVTWYYGTSQQWNSQTQQNETYAYITSGADKYTGDLTVPSSLGGYVVKGIGSCAFQSCSALTSVMIPSSVTSIGSSAFYSCSALMSVTIPSSVTYIGRNAFCGCSGLTSVTFLGAPPNYVKDSGLLSSSASDRNVSASPKYASAWQKLTTAVYVLSSTIRVNDPTILDVVYKVTSAVTNTVKVRVLAFEDGVRSFAKVVRPETFVADVNGVKTAGNVGDHVAANVEHTLSWKVSSDWSNQLAKVSFEVLATEGDLLPLEVRTIPASDQYGKMDVTRNAITKPRASGSTRSCGCMRIRMRK